MYLLEYYLEQAFGTILIFSIIGGLIWGFIAKAIMDNKGYENHGYFWWGFFFGLIPVIIAACKPTCYSQQSITHPAFSPSSVYTSSNAANLAGCSWKCICGQTNANYIGTCSCGRSRRDVERCLAEPKERETVAALSNKENTQDSPKTSAKNQMEGIATIKAYKDLLDSGVISQEDFDKKKKELLNI